MGDMVLDMAVDTTVDTMVDTPTADTEVTDTTSVRPKLMPNLNSLLPMLPLPMLMLPNIMPPPLLATVSLKSTSVRLKLMPNLRLKPPPMLTMATTAVDTDTDMGSMVPDITVMEPDTTATTVMPVTVTPPMPTAVSTSVKPKPPLMLTMATTVMPAATSTAAPKV